MKNTLMMVVLIFLMSACARTKYVSYQINTTPAGSRITSLEGLDYGTSPTDIFTTSGKSNEILVTFVAKQPGYLDTKLNTSLQLKHPTKTASLTDVNRINIQMDPPYYGSFKVITEPSGAYVSHKFNNMYIGTSPTGVVWGYNSGGTMEFVIRIEKPGYNTVEKTISLVPNCRSEEVAKNNPFTVFVLLQPSNSANSQTNTVNITSDPSGASVYGNQNYWGTTPLTVPVMFANNNSQVEIRFEKSGYGTERRVLTVTDQHLHIVLQRN